MNSEIRKSKIYSYFYGAGNVFQQFVIAVGILCMLLAPVSTEARYVKVRNAQEKYEKLMTVTNEYDDVYSDLYVEYTTGDRYNFNCTKYDEAEIVEGDKHVNEKTAHNEALGKYDKASDEASSAYSKWRSLDSFFSTATDEEIAAAKAEYDRLNAVAGELDTSYSAVYDKYNTDEYKFICTKYEEAPVAENDKYATEKAALNSAYSDYSKAAEKSTKAHEKYISLRDSGSAGEILFPIIGVITIVVGVIWSIIKKLSFGGKSGEEAYDEEIQIRIEEAKVKALEKLNIVAEQIDKVEPVVLNGIAVHDTSPSKKTLGVLAPISSGFFMLLSSVIVIVIGAVGAALYSGIAFALAQISAFFLAVIGAVALVAFLGLKVYKKYEVEGYVNPKTIKKLEKLYPTLLFKLGTDDQIRVSLPAITVYMFGDEQLYMYYQYFDIITGKIFCEGIHEYFYEDIVGVISAQETKKLFKRTGFLKLFVKSTDYLKESITVVSSGCQHSESYIVPMGGSLLDTSFVGMRNLIRQKKTDSE